MTSLPSLSAGERNKVMPEIEVIDPFASDRWDREIQRFPAHTIFHRTAWARVLVESYGHRPRYLRLSGPEGAAWLPLMEVCSRLTGCRAVSLPFADFAGPLCERPTGLDSAARALEGFGPLRPLKHIELRLEPPHMSSLPAFREYLGHEIDLAPGIAQVEANLTPAARRAIRKAEREGVEVTIDTGPQAIETFYRLHRRTRRRHGLPPQPVRFFRAISRHVISAGLGEVLFAWFNRQAVAGAVFLHSGSRAVYKFGASDPACWQLRPNQAIMWAAMRRLVDAGFASLHLGRTSENDDGLSRFKRSLGGRIQRLVYHRFHLPSRAWLGACPTPAESYSGVFGRLPLSLNQLAGSLIYPHLD